VLSLECEATVGAPLFLCTPSNHSDLKLPSHFNVTVCHWSSQIWLAAGMPLSLSKYQIKSSPYQNQFMWGGMPYGLVVHNKLSAFIWLTWEWPYPQRTPSDVCVALEALNSIVIVICAELIGRLAAVALLWIVPRPQSKTPVYVSTARCAKMATGHGGGDGGGGGAEHVQAMVDCVPPKSLLPLDTTH